MNASVGGPSSNAHVINQSLKPKMIMNTSAGASSSQNRQGSAHAGHSQNNQLSAHGGDIQVSNIQITNSQNRPQSSKIVKKKAAASGSHSNHQYAQHSVGVTFINNFTSSGNPHQQ